MSLDDILRSGLGDFRLQTIHWADSGNDVVLSLVPPPRYGTESISLKFRWVTELDFNLAFNNLMGMPMLWEASFNRTGEWKWEVCFDFAGAPQGMITFNCNAIELVEQ